MSRIFRIETAVGTALIIALITVVFVAGCSKKQPTPPKAPATVEQKKPAAQTPAPSPAAESNDQNAAALPVNTASENKTTADARPQTKADVPVSAESEKSAAISQLKGPSLPEPETFKPYESLNDSQEKIDFITEYGEEHPESMPAVVYKALDDANAEVRSAAMEMLATADSTDPNVVYVAEKALGDTEPQIRQNAVEACAAVTDPVVENVLIAALSDSSEEVRNAAMQVADQKEPEIRLPVLKAGIASQYEDIKEDVVSSLIDVSSPAAVDILITGLKDPNPDFRDSVRSAIDFLVSQEFETYDQAIKWWNANRNKFDNELNEK